MAWSDVELNALSRGTKEFVRILSVFKLGAKNGKISTFENLRCFSPHISGCRVEILGLSDVKFHVESEYGLTFSI